MTRIAITSSRPSPAVAAWNAPAVPWKLVVTLWGRIPWATPFTAVTAWPSEAPGLRLKERVTGGSCPGWLAGGGTGGGCRYAAPFGGDSVPEAVTEQRIDSSQGA